MPNANEDGARPPELRSTVLRAALAALPIAIEVFARGGERRVRQPGGRRARSRRRTTTAPNARRRSSAVAPS